MKRIRSRGHATASRRRVVCIAFDSSADAKLAISETVNPNQDTYWLYGWLLANKVRTVEDAARLLSRSAALKEMRKVAEQWLAFVDPAPPAGVNLVAGTGLRLNDSLTCPNPACRRQQIDVLFRHVWHYFDRVLLPDGVGDILLNPPRHWKRGEIQRRLLDLIALVLYIQDIGAEGLVSHHPTLTPPESLGDILTPDQGGVWSDAWRDVENILRSQARITVKKVANRRYDVDCLDPILNIGAVIEIELSERDRASEATVRRRAIHQFLHGHIDALAEDLYSRRALGAPLGANVWSHEKVLATLGGVEAIGDAAFHLSLPSLAHVPVRDLVALRKAEGAAFEAFRGALGNAIRERLENRNAAAVAEEISRDLIDPELARIRQRLRAAQYSLRRKSALSVVLAAVATTCGLLIGGGPVVAGAAGVGALVSVVGAAASKYLDDKQAIRMADLYFVWKALRHAG